MGKLKTDRFVFWGSLIVLISVCIPIIIFPSRSEIVLDRMFHILTHQFGFIYIWVGILALIFGIWIASSRYGQIILGDQGQEPEFNLFSWAGMLFCSGIGSSVLYWGMVEWIYYLDSPPLGLQNGSWQAVEWAATYGLFHWGPTAWMLYALPALPIGYSYYVKKKPILKISESCRALLGDRVDGILGKLINISFIFGLLGGSATTLGLGVPMVSAGISELFAISDSSTLKLVVLFLVTVIFATSAYHGLKKGIRILSNLNLMLLFVVLSMVFIFGPTNFIIKMGTTSIGLLMQNFVRMNTWMDPILGSGFPEKWTVFYWAWWVIYAPFMGLFIARISRGRTIRGIIGGTVLFGTIGCTVVFIILGNFGLNLHLEGTLAVTELIQSNGAADTIATILKTLPFGSLVLTLFISVAIVFLATSFDSASYTLAAVTTEKLPEDREPEKWNRLFWAFALSLLPASFMLVNSSLSSLQTASIIGGIPVVPILIIMMSSFVKVLKADETEDKRSQVDGEMIYLSSFTECDRIQADE